MSARVVAGIAGILALIVVDQLTIGYPTLAAALVLGPLAVASRGTLRETIVVAAVALAGAIVDIATAADLSSRWFLAVLIVAVGGALAALLAGTRARAEAEAERARDLTAVERRLSGALAALGEAVTVTGPDGNMLYVNDAAVELLRAGTREDLLTAGSGAVMAHFAVYDEQGHPLGSDALPTWRVLAGERDVPPLLVRNVVLATGEERWLLTKASPVGAAGNEPDAVVTVIEDVTAIKRAELQERLLASAGQVLARSLDRAETLQRVAEVTVPVLGDWCAVALNGRAGAVDEVAVAHSDPEKVRLARELQERRVARLDDESPRSAVLRGDADTTQIEIPEGALEAVAEDAEHLAMLRELALSSMLIVPLDAGGRRLGAITLARSDARRAFAPEDVALAEALARRSATAVLNAELYTQHVEIAATLQRGMLPPQLPRIPGWSAAALYHPAGEVAEVGGDFFDAFPAGEDWMVLIGDVTGHGPEAATLTALARYTLRTAAELTRDPVTAIAHLNEALRGRAEMSLCTAACMRLRLAGPDAGSVAIASAGHPLPVLLREGTTRRIGESGPLAGAFDGVSWPLREEPVRPGDIVVLFTDGVLDAISHRGRLDEDRLLEHLRNAPRGAAALIAHLQAALAVEPEQRRDDIAALALAFEGAPVPAGV
jgi:serine phosphatase RsbU (regulator of sigma subunit)/PAS domain-containing protein